MKGLACNRFQLLVGSNEPFLGVRNVLNYPLLLLHVYKVLFVSPIHNGFQLTDHVLIERVLVLSVYDVLELVLQLLSDCHLARQHHFRVPEDIYYILYTQWLT